MDTGTALKINVLVPILMVIDELNLIVRPAEDKKIDRNISITMIGSTRIQGV